MWGCVGVDVIVRAVVHLLASRVDRLDSASMKALGNAFFCVNLDVPNIELLTSIFNRRRPGVLPTRAPVPHTVVSTTQ